MTISKYNNSPYYDDFDETKGFYRILFRPEKSVQARELNQLQTIINNQFDVLTSHIFKDGSPVRGGNVSFDTKYSYVKLETLLTYNSTNLNMNNYYDLLQDTIVTGLTSGVEARVLQVVAPENDDPYTIYVRYESSGTDNVTKTFQPGEYLEFDAGALYYGRVKPIGDVPTGFGANFTVDEGYWYVNGCVVYAPRSNIVLSKYTPNDVTIRVIYKIIEEVIDEFIDVSLKSNALGTPNASGSGANRQKISLQLRTENIDFDLRDESDSLKIIQLIVIEDSVVKKSARTVYSELGDILAQRTYEESGNYTLNNFGIIIKEHLNSTDTPDGQYTSDNGGDLTKIAVGIERGIAYVYGYRIDVEDTVYIPVDKARDTETVNARALTVRVGNYLMIDTLVGRPDIDTFGLITIKNSGGTSIGTCRARAIIRVGATNFRLYVFDIEMTGSNSFATASTLEQSTTFSASLIDTTIRDANYNSLIFPLPYSNVKSLRSITSDEEDHDAIIDFQYETIYTFDGTTNSSGAYTHNTSNDDIFFFLNNTSDFIVTNSSSGALIPTSAYTVTINNPPSSVTFAFNSSYYNTPINVVSTVRKVNLIEKTKTLVQDATITINIPNQVGGNYDNLGKCDVVRIKSIINGTKNITSRYVLDDGQRDNYYTQSRIRLRDGYAAPVGAITVTFDYFQHGVGDYFIVNSYSNDFYEKINSYNGNSLRDVIDFRPVKNETGSGFTGTGASVNAMVSPNSIIQTDIEYYLPRIDKVYVTKTGEFGTVKGISSLNPKSPPLPKESMQLYDLSIGAYTFKTKDVIPTLFDNSRSTMADIRDLTKRVENLEYYTALTLLERETANQKITDDNGIDRYKNGFLVDSFHGHNYSNVRHPDYRCSMDVKQGILRPSFYQENLKLNFSTAGSSNYQITGDIISLPYTPVTEIKQPYASLSVNVNPYNVFVWGGSIRLSPSTDEWKDTKTRPDVIVNNDGIYDSIVDILDEADVIGTVWDEWQTNWSGTTKDKDTSRVGNLVTVVNTTTTTRNQSRDGILTTLQAPATINTNIGERIVEVNYIPYMRSRLVFFSVTNMKPNTRVYPFFDGVPISAYTKAESFKSYSSRVDDEDITNYLNRTSHPFGSTNLVTNANGALTGSFLVPNNKTIKFRTGARTFKLSDSNVNNPSLESTFAEVIYEARGIVETKENVVISTDVPRIDRSEISSTRTLVNTTRDVKTVYVDPLAQSFIIDRDGGCFATSVDIFFATKDPKVPVKLQIRVMENGLPTQIVVPNSEVVLTPSQVNVSNNGATLTRFTFPTLVYLQDGVEYALVLLSNSNKYNVYVAKLGDFDVTKPSFRIDKQPYNGVFFKSQNASTWTPEQDMDLKFSINRARFTTASGSVRFVNSKIGLSTLTNDPLLFTTGSNDIRVFHKNHGMFNNSRVFINGVVATSGSTVNGIPLSQINGVTHTIKDVEYDSYVIQVTTNATLSGREGGEFVLASENNLYNVIRPNVQELILNNTDVTYAINSVSCPYFSDLNATHALKSFKNITPNTNYTFDNPRVILSSYNEVSFLTGNKSFGLTCALTRTSGEKFDNVSPIIDMNRLSVTTIANRIDRPSATTVAGKNKVANYIGETVAKGGSCLAKHISKKQDLNEAAENLKIIVDVCRPTGSYFDMYYKLSTNDDTDFDSLGWTYVAPDIGDIPYSDNPLVYNEVQYTLDEADLGGQSFTSFATKIVFQSRNTSRVPTAKKLREIATL